MQASRGMSNDVLDDWLNVDNNTHAPVNAIYATCDGNTLKLNTRSAQAPEQAGVLKSQWNAVNVTGNAKAEARLTGQLLNAPLRVLVCWNRC